MTRLIHATLAVLLLWAVGCSRPPVESAATSVPEALVQEAAGKVAFFEFYSPT